MPGKGEEKAHTGVIACLRHFSLRPWYFSVQAQTPESAGRQGHVQSSLVDCPNCKLVNPPDAERCDCGYDFRTRTIEQSYVPEPSMFGYDQPKQKERVDYTGPKSVAILAPVFFLIAFLSNADVALAACIVLGMIVLAIKMRWDLRKHLWFWAIIAFILALHVPLVFVVRWPQGKLPTLFYAMPIGIADLLIILGAVGLAERFLSKDSSSKNQLA